MRAVLAKALVLALMIPSIGAAAVEVHDYDPEREIPEVKIIGPETPEFREAGQKLRQRLIENLAYWQKRGLPDPPDLKRIFIFSDPKDLTVLEIMTALNPDAMDAEGKLGFYDHLKQQRAALENSELVKGLDQFRRSNEALRDRFDHDNLLDFVFDHFCLLRYGYAVSHTWTAVEKGTKVSETAPLPIMPAKDNAFYGRFPQIDLSQFLKPSLPDADAKKEIFDVAFFEDLKKKFEQAGSPDLFSRRIVILPRTTEGQGARGIDGVSSLFDGSLETHELGHHIVASLSYKYMLYNRLLDEVFADYLSFAVSGNPKIGAHFAHASGEIARRLGEQPKLTEKETFLKARFERLAAKGLARDFSEPATIETIHRHERLGNPLENAYEGGNPARSFLFQTREALDAREREAFDAITLDVIADLGHAPWTVASANGTAVFLRHIKSMMVELTVRKKERDRILSSEDPRVEAILDQARIELRADAKEMAKLEKYRSEPERFQKELDRRSRRRALRLVGEGGFNVETEAWLASRARLDQMEKEHTVGKRLLEWETPRPATFADYSTPEFLRAYFRAARAKAPELVDRILERSGQVMNATPVRLQLRDGAEDVAFVRNPNSPQWAWAREEVQTVLQTLRDLRTEIDGLRVQSPYPEKKLKEKLEAYDRALEGLQEFERTNSWFKLKFPNPVAQLARLGLNALGAKAERAKADQDAAAKGKGPQTSCVEPLTKI